MVKNIKILLIEDNRVVRRLLEMIIEKSPDFCLVAQVESAEMALSEVETRQPDLIIVDIGLPGLSGIDATRMIKSAFPRIKVLMLTARSSDQLFFDSFAAGADGYVLKDSFSEEKLRTALDTVSLGRVWLDPLIARRVLDYDTDYDSLRKTAVLQADTVQGLTDEEKKVLETLAGGGESAKKISEELDKSFLGNLSRFSEDS